MKIVCAPDSFKGTAAAMDVASAMVRGLSAMTNSNQCAELVACPIADGGEGTAEVIAAVAGGRWVEVDDVVAPCGDRVTGRYLLDESRRRAVVELATVSGLSLVGDGGVSLLDRTSYGTGQLIRHAMEHADGESGAGLLESVIVGVGGSGTCDAGLGLIQAMGAQLRDVAGRVMDEGVAARDGMRLRSVEAPEVGVSIRVAADVTNPLVGSNGAARVYGPQKGATAVEVAALEAILERVVGIAGMSGDVERLGAAGGAAYGLHVWAGATVESGIDLVLDSIGFDSMLDGADLVLTGEGCYDDQSAFGKAVGGVTDRAQRRGIPVGLMAGSIGAGADLSPFAGAVSLEERCGAARSMSETTACVALCAPELVSRILG